MRHLHYILLTGAAVLLAGFCGSAVSSEQAVSLPAGAAMKGKPVTAPDGRILYAVHLQDAPLVLHAFGDAPGKIRKGERSAVLKSARSEAYRQKLKVEQENVIAGLAEKLGREPQVMKRYQLAVNGMVLSLTPAEADVLRRMPGVRHVQPATRHFPHTDRGPLHTGAPAIWESLAVPAGTRGEGMIIGIIDTGIRPDHPSFADVGDDGYDHDNPLGAGVYLGDCLEPDAAHYCNDKLIGIVSFPEITETFGDLAPPYGIDNEGHGTHVASIAAGNVLHDVPAYNELGFQGEYEFDEISGVAPHANIVSYQICYPGGWGCDPFLVPAVVEHAIEHGIDVLNYSIGGWAIHPWYTFDGMAFLSARAAGIDVVTSAGNEGPEAWTISSPGNAPWLTSVAAYTHDRAFGEIQLNNFAGGDGAPGAAMTGKGVTAGLTADVVFAGDFGDELCLAPFEPATFTGEIVVCLRGENPRVEKGANVLAGGAGGMVLVNVDGGDDNLVADFHALPAIHLGADDGNTLRAWLESGAGHAATITATVVAADPAVADRAATFSSRGPAYPISNVLAPHIAAPGVDIYAAFVEDMPFEEEAFGAPFSMQGGTSMASPHVAGALALLRALYPEWTPAERQSAMMLTAVTDTRDERGVASVAFDHGAGRIDIPAAANAALVMDISEDEYVAADPWEGGDATSLNMAALVNDECLIECSWTRRFRALEAGTWTVTGSSGNPDIEIVADPAVFTVVEDEIQDVEFRLSLQTETPTAGWMFGEVQLLADDAGVPSHHLPLAANVVTSIVPDWIHVYTSRNGGSQRISNIRTRTVEGLRTSVLAAAADRHEFDLRGDDTPDELLDDPEGVVFFTSLTITQPGEILVAETLDTGSDIDLYVGLDTDGDGVPSPEELENELICVSASFLGSENCVIFQLEPGTYWIMVHNYLGDFEPTPQVLLTAVVSEANEDFQATAPENVLLGDPYDVTLSWQQDMEFGEVMYAIVSLGDEASPDNVASIPVKLERWRDDFRVLTAVDAIDAGKPIMFTMRFDENRTSGEDREYRVEMELPAQVSMSDAEGEPTVDGNRFAWNVRQEADSPSTRVSFTVVPDKALAGTTLALHFDHELVESGAPAMRSKSPDVILLGNPPGPPPPATNPPVKRGGGSYGSGLLMLMLLLGIRSIRMRRRMI